MGFPGALGGGRRETGRQTEGSGELTEDAGKVDASCCWPHFMLLTGHRRPGLQSDLQRQETKKSLEVRLDLIPPADTDANISSHCEGI